MLPDLKQKLKAYVDRFNAEDEELYAQAVNNAGAYAYLSENVPLLDCPDETLERTYYFRWWTLRKHWKETPVGHILTEFLPPVRWAGPYNSINCAVGHHLREARWLRDPEGWLWEYVGFWLEGPGDALSYSSWIASALEDCFALRPDPKKMERWLPLLDALYRRREERQLRPCGLFWSNDGRDGMEYSISGPGIRPSLNSYMYGNARSISRMAACAGMTGLSESYRQKAEQVKERMERLLWDGDFYRTIPCAEGERADWTERPELAPEHCARELIGYLPWYFSIPSPDKADAFAHLNDPDGFAAPYGLTTAERRHPGFRRPYDHECLWNGEVWPFATAQTLTAAAAHLREQGEIGITKADFCRLLMQYAESHRITDGQGRQHMWIDENMDPFTGEWIARGILENDGWNIRRGGRERGKDYNHSTFCDLVLSGLLGIRAENGKICADPILPQNWDYFLVTGLTRDNWTVLYDRDGSRYGCGAGLRAFRAQDAG